MKQFITTLKYIELEEFKEEYIELIPGVKISNNVKLKNKILTQESILIMGIIESEFIRDSNAFLIYEYDNDEEIFKGHSNLQILERILSWIDDIQKNLWLIRDNCVCCDTAYLIHSENEIPREASMSRLQYQFNKSTGDLESTKFSKNDLLEFAKYHDDIETHFHSKESNSSNFMLQKNFSRINRGLIFVKQAREARNLAYKVSNYCSAFETLFSTDNAELSHKLSERISFFLKEDFNKLDTFKTIKKAYGIRSKLTHGDTLDIKQIETLGELSYKIDEILRVCFNKILRESPLTKMFESPKNVIDSYFDEIIFSQ